MPEMQQPGIFFVNSLECIPTVATNVFDIERQLRLRLTGLYLQDVIESCQELDEVRPHLRTGKFSGDSTDCASARDLARRHNIRMRDNGRILEIYLLVCHTRK